jgi:nitroreductase
MNIPFPIKSTIDARRSTRSYKMTEVDAEIMKSLKAFAEFLPVPFEHDVLIRFFKARETKTLYMTMKSPPDSAAFIAKTDPLSISKTGFAGELFILFAQSKGLSTCWYGHYKLAELERLMPHLENAEQLKGSKMGYGYSKGECSGKRAICVTPLGYHEENGLRLLDRVMKKTVSFKRKEIKELLTDPHDFVKLPDDILYALDLGRKAPSAMNSQMWRFAFEDHFNTIAVSMPPGYKHLKWEHPNVDIGICACHVWLGLVDKGHDPKVSVNEDGGRAVWRISL